MLPHPGGGPTELGAAGPAVSLGGRPSGRPSVVGLSSVRPGRVAGGGAWAQSPGCHESAPEEPSTSALPGSATLGPVVLRRALTVAWMAATVLAVCASPAGADPTSTLARGRALEAYAAMQKYFFSAHDRSYAGTYPARGRAQAWPYSQALWATVDLAGLPGIGAGLRTDLLDRIEALSAYSHPEPGRPSEFAPVYGGQGRVYYDDNLWIALALVQSSRVETKGSPLTTARQLFDLITDGWDSNGADPCPGGVFWTRLGANHDRNTVTTANAAVLALRLYRTSHSPRYLAWARKAYLWTQRCLGTPSGLVSDHIDLRGNIDRHTWSYNQGAMIAAGVQLFQATGNRRYLADAVHTADASLHEIGDPIGSGEPPVFLAIFYRDLLELAAVVDGRSDRSALEAFADEAWTKRTQPAHRALSLLGPWADAARPGGDGGGLRGARRHRLTTPAGRRSALRRRTGRSRPGGACRSRSGPSRPAARPRR